MNDIAKKLKAYIEAHPVHAGDGEGTTVLDQLYLAYAESHESDPRNFFTPCRWTTTTQCSASAAACAAHMSGKPLSMACNTART